MNVTQNTHPVKRAGNTKLNIQLNLPILFDIYIDYVLIVNKKTMGFLLSESYTILT